LATVTARRAPSASTSNRLVEPWNCTSTTRPATPSWSGPGAPNATRSGRIETARSAPVIRRASSPVSTFAVPTKPATNVVRGRAYSSRGGSTCSTRPWLNTATRSDIDSASP
jgi:hypothetical protein